MNIGYDKLLLELEFKLKKLDWMKSFLKKLDDINLKMNKVGRVINKTNGQWVGMGNALKKIQAQQDKVAKGAQWVGMGNALKKIQAQQDKVAKGAQNLNAKFLGFGLALLFGGMAIKKFSQDMIRSIGNAFMLLSDESSAGVKGILAMQASLQFLKFILFDTFANTDLFAGIVEFIVNLVNRISEFIQLHPGLTKILFVLLAFGVVFGSLVMLAGQLGLAAIGMASAFNIGIGGALGILAVLAAVIVILIAIWTSGLSDTWKHYLTLITVIVAVLAVLRFLKVSLVELGKATPLLLLIAAIIGVGIALWNAKDRLGGFWNFFKAIGAGFLKLMVMWGDSIINNMIEPIETLISWLAKLAKAAGMTELAASLSGAQTALRQTRRLSNNAAFAAMTGIDKLFGIDKIRAEQNISGDDPFALFNELAFGTGGGETIGTGESELERATKATEGVTATDFSEQQKEIDDKIEEGNKISEEMKDNDKERNAILTETNKILANMDAKIAEVGVIAPSTEL